MIVWVESQGYTRQLNPDIVSESQVIRDLCHDVECDDEITIPLLSTLSTYPNNIYVGLTKDEIKSDLILADYLIAPNATLNIGINLINSRAGLSERELDIIYRYPELLVLLSYYDDSIEYEVPYNHVVDRLLTSLDISAEEEYNNMNLYDLLLLDILTEGISNSSNSLMESVAEKLMYLVKFPYPIELFDILLLDDEFVSTLLYNVSEGTVSYGGIINIIPYIIKYGITSSSVLMRGYISKIIAIMIKDNYSRVNEIIEAMSELLVLTDDDEPLITALRYDRYVDKIIDSLLARRHNSLYCVVDIIINEDKGSYLQLIAPLIELHNQDTEISMNSTLKLDDDNARVSTIEELLAIDINPRYYTRLLNDIILSGNINLYKALGSRLELTIDYSAPIDVIINNPIFRQIANIESGIQLSITISRRLDIEDVRMLLLSSIRNWVFEHLQFRDLVNVMDNVIKLIDRSPTELARQYIDIVLRVLEVINPDYASVIVNDSYLGDRITDEEVEALRLERDNSINWKHMFDNSVYWNQMFGDYNPEDELFIREWDLFIKNIIENNDQTNYNRAIDYYELPWSLSDVSRDKPVNNLPPAIVTLTIDEAESNELFDDILYNQSIGRFNFELRVKIVGRKDEVNKWVDNHRYHHQLIKQLVR